MHPRTSAEASKKVGTFVDATPTRKRGLHRSVKDEKVTQTHTEASQELAQAREKELLPRLRGGSLE